MDPELEIQREFIREWIYQKLVQHRAPMTAEMQTKLKELVRRLEVALYRSSASREEYLNIDTLDNRLYTLIKRLPAPSHSQQLPHNASSSSISTMIPTPGMSPSGNTNLAVTSPLDGSMNSTSGSINAVDGAMSNGYQQAPSHVIGSGNFQFSVNSEPLDSGGGFSGVEPTMVSQSQLHRKRQIDAQNNCILPSFGGQIGGKRSTLQQNLPSYGVSNGDLNGGSGLIGNEMQLSGSAVSDSYLTTSQFGDDYSMNLVDLSRSKSNSSLTSSQPIQEATQTKKLEQAGDAARIAEQGKQEAELKVDELEKKVVELEDKLAKKDNEVATTFARVPHKNMKDYRAKLRADGLAVPLTLPSPETSVISVNAEEEAAEGYQSATIVES